jgi:phosphatidate cytidylyltransferase
MFIKRFLSSIALMVIFLCAFLIKGNIGLTVFTVIGIILSIACVREFSNLLSKIKIKTFSVISEAFACLFFLAIIIEKKIGTETDIGLFILALFAIYCWLKILFSKQKKEIISNCAASSLSIAAIIIPLNCLTLIYMSNYNAGYSGVSLALFLILVTKFGDIGAYCTGTLTSKRSAGNHKIVPTISPKKSWEGTIGGLITSVIIAYILVALLNINFGSNGVLLTGILGVLLFIGGFVGDLSESVLKRMTGIKDSGAIIPGIGGALDLTDSLFINAPLFYICLKLFQII